MYNIIAKERKKPGFDHKKIKEKTPFWVAAMPTLWPIYPAGWKCKDVSCTLYPDPGPKCNEMSKMECGLAQ